MIKLFIQSILNFFKKVDLNKDGTPDVEQVKSRVKRVKEEMIDVVDAIHEVGNQIDDIHGALKGEARKGRKK